MDVPGLSINCNSYLKVFSACANFIILLLILTSLPKFSLERPIITAKSCVVCYELRPRTSMKTRRCGRPQPIGILCEWFRPIAGTHQEDNPRPPCVLPHLAPPTLGTCKCRTDHVQCPLGPLVNSRTAGSVFLILSPYCHILPFPRSVLLKLLGNILNSRTPTSQVLVYLGYLGWMLSILLISPDTRGPLIDSVFPVMPRIVDNDDRKVAIQLEDFPASASRLSDDRKVSRSFVDESRGSADFCRHQRAQAFHPDV